MNVVPNSKFMLLAFWCLWLVEGAITNLAFSQGVGGIFIVDSPEPALQQTRIALKGRPLLVASARSERAVRLERSFDAKAANPAGLKLNRHLVAGEVLISPSNTNGVYCTPIKQGLLFAAAPCFADLDQDGSFESALSATFSSDIVAGLAITEKGALFGVKFSERIPLEELLPYKEIEYEESPSASIRLVWESNFKKRAPGAVGLALWFDAGDKSTGTGVLTESVIYSLEGGAGDVEIAGHRIRVFGFEPNGAIRYQIEAIEPKQRVSFMFRAAPKTIYLN